jgi:hypothetical protein
VRLIRIRSDPERFDRLIGPLLAASIFGLPLHRLGREYYQATLEETGEDVSFLIENKDQAVVAVMANIINGRFERYGMPAEILCADTVEPAVGERAIKEAIGEIRHIMSSTGLSCVDLLTRSPGQKPDLLSAKLISANFEPEPYFSAVVDLSAGPDELLADMRKGHRQDIEWGRENLESFLVDEHRPDPDAFQSYRKLHADVAGHVTRGDLSWRAMFRAIETGNGRLVLSFLKRQLVSGTLVLDAGDTAYYASGAYRREMFPKPLSHYPVFVAFEGSADAGRRWFNVGDASISPRMSDKERSIADFKRGFTSRLRFALRWRWTPAEAFGRPRMVNKKGDAQR